MSEKDHPRIRGEHLHHLVRSVFVDGSSPHTRGALRHFAPPSPRVGIIPAYAGSTTATNASSPTAMDHPRIRGEHFDRSVWAVRAAGSSPHTRGARPNIGAWAMRNTDHPRIRGEHASGRPRRRSDRGSSPHTRGALPHARPLRQAGRIIPAYAGSTDLMWCAGHP